MHDRSKRVGKQRIAAHIVRTKLKQGIEIKQADAEEMVDMVVEGMFLAVINGFAVSFSNLGSITPVATEARTRRNPQTGEKVYVPAGKRIRWLTSDHLNDVLNGRSKRFTSAKRGPGSPQ